MNNEVQNLPGLYMKAFGTRNPWRTVPCRLLKPPRRRPADRRPTSAYHDPNIIPATDQMKQKSIVQKEYT